MPYDFETCREYSNQDPDTGIDCSNWHLAIHNFIDHPQIKGRDRKTIYLLADEFYLATNTRLYPIDIKRIEYTNMGEPYRELARISFTHPLTSNDSLDIDIEDAAQLYLYYNNTGYEISADPELIRHKDFIAAIDQLSNED